MRYYELAKGKVSNRNFLIRDNLLDKVVEENRIQQAELYHSTWLYDYTINYHIAQNHTVRSFKGKRKIPVIIFDIDMKQDTDEFVLQRTREFVKLLQDDWKVDPEELEIYYSGRGYHIYLPDYFKFEEGFVTPADVRNTLTEYFPETDVSPYQSAGLIRAPYSLNVRTNRFKIPLTYEELTTLTAQQIIKLSESNNKREVPRAKPDNTKDWHSKIMQGHVERKELAYRDEPTRIVTCMQHLFNKGERYKQRHTDLMRLISSWRRMGQTQEACVVLAQKFCPSLHEYEIRRMVKDTFDRGYAYGCNDKVMMEFCDPKCIYYEYKNYVSTIQGGDDVRSILVNDAKLKRQNKFINLKDVFHLEEDYKIYLGELVIFWGDTKMGKSTLVQNIVMYNPNIKWLYLPLENGIALDSRRMIQIKTGLPKAEIERVMDEGTYEEQMSLVDHINEIKFTEDSVTLQGLRKIVAEQDPDMIVIDTVDQMKYTGKDYNEGIRTLTAGLRDLTKMKKSVFVIHHISKHAAQDEEGRMRKLTIHSGIGTSALEQKADKVIGIEGLRDAKIRTVSSLGARDESSFSVKLSFDPVNFRLIPLNGKAIK